MIFNTTMATTFLQTCLAADYSMCALKHRQYIISPVFLDVNIFTWLNRENMEDELLLVKNKQLRIEREMYSWSVVIRWVCAVWFCRVYIVQHTCIKRPYQCTTPEQTPVATPSLTLIKHTLDCCLSLRGGSLRRSVIEMVAADKARHTPAPVHSQLIIE